MDNMCSSLFLWRYLHVIAINASKIVVWISRAEKRKTFELDVS